MKYFLSIVFSFLSAAMFAESTTSGWALVNIPVACIREGDSHASEMSSQAIMGMPLRILEDNGGEWLLIESPDTYRGYMNISSVFRMFDHDMEAWKKSPRLVVTSMAEAKVYTDTVSPSVRSIVTELVNGSILAGRLGNGTFSHVTLPDGRNGWISTSAVTPAEQWASTPFDADAILDRCYYLMGTPYLWGACSTKSVDCSGLVRVAYYANGILTLRDARQQIDIGQRIAPADTSSLRPADLLFFSNTPDGRISHVALYDSDGRYIHSSGRVKTNYMRPDDPDFAPRFYRGASRIDGAIPSPGITAIIDHSWYF